MLRKKQMDTTITLTAEQIGLLLQTLSEQIAKGGIDLSDRQLASDVLDILEDAENAVFSSSI